MHRPSLTEYASYFEKYIALVPEENILSALEAQLDEMIILLRGVPEAEANVRHAPYT